MHPYESKRAAEDDERSCSWSRKPKVSEVICEKDGTLIHSQHRRLHR